VKRIDTCKVVLEQEGLNIGLKNDNVDLSARRK